MGTSFRHAETIDVNHGVGLHETPCPPSPPQKNLKVGNAKLFSQICCIFHRTYLHLPVIYTLRMRTKRKLICLFFWWKIRRIGRSMLRFFLFTFHCACAKSADCLIPKTLYPGYAHGYNVVRRLSLTTRQCRATVNEDRVANHGSTASTERKDHRGLLAAPDDT